MKKATFKKKSRKPLKRTKIKFRGTSETSVLKERIQSLVREIVIKRDGGCVLRKYRHCNGADKIVFQADHLVSRANSATYADTRLIVCVCRNCHGWKHWHKNEYDDLLRSILPKERVELWEKCEQESWQPKRTSAMDWNMEIINLENEFKKLQ